MKGMVIKMSADEKKRFIMDKVDVCVIGAGHAGCEDDFPVGRTDCAVRLTDIHLPVFKDKDCVFK